MDKKKNILVVDDDPNIIRLIKFYVSKKYHVEGAHRGMEAIELLTNNNFDLILVDMFMPQMDGLTFLKEVKKRMKLDALVILVTAQDPTDQTLKTIMQYGYDIIQKPFTARRLQLTIHNALRYKSLLEEYNHLTKKKE